MAYKLKKQENISEGIKRIATEQIDKAIREIRDVEAIGVDKSIHQVRKRLKKIRAIVRLVRDCFGKETYKKENARFRDMARSLSNLRDAKVHIETLDDLKEDFADLFAPEVFTNIRRELEIDYLKEYQKVFDENVFSSLTNQLKNAKTEIADWKFTSDNRLEVESSLKRVYKRGYKRLSKAISKPSVTNFHQWRKRVKYLRYQLRILRIIWPNMMRELVDLTHDLSDHLGEDHDLAVLKQFISNQPERFSFLNLDSPDDQTVIEILMASIDNRRKKLQSAALFLGQRIYTESPTNFVKRLSAYWDIYLEETRSSNF